MEAYFEAKMRLFDEVVEPGGAGDLDRRSPDDEVVARAAARAG